MAFDETLAKRVRLLLDRERNVSERKMFGGLAFMVDGNMCCGVEQDRLMARVGAEGYRDALALPYAGEMTFTGKPLKGFVYVEAAGIERDADLERWVRRCVGFVGKLPPK